MKILLQESGWYITDITPVSYYSYNSSSKKENADSLLALLIQTVASYTIFFQCLGLLKRTQTIS
jgi:hypothetical protein